MGADGLVRVVFRPVAERRAGLGGGGPLEGPHVQDLRAVGRVLVLYEASRSNGAASWGRSAAQECRPSIRDRAPTLRHRHRFTPLGLVWLALLLLFTGVVLPSVRSRHVYRRRAAHRTLATLLGTVRRMFPFR